MFQPPTGPFDDAIHDPVSPDAIVVSSVFRSYFIWILVPSILFIANVARTALFLPGRW
jgi:hypothetical protein